MILFPVYAAISVWQMKETTLWTCCIRTITVCLGSALCVLCKHILNWCNIPVGLWRVEESLSPDKTVNVDMVELTLFCNTFSGPLLFCLLAAGQRIVWQFTVLKLQLSTIFPKSGVLHRVGFLPFIITAIHMLTCCASLTSRVFDSKRRSWWLMISFLLYACSHCLTPHWLKE